MFQFIVSHRKVFHLLPKLFAQKQKVTAVKADNLKPQKRVKSDLLETIPVFISKKVESTVCQKSSKLKVGQEPL